MGDIDAVICRGGALLDARVPQPRYGPLDLLVAVEAVSVNPVDTKVLRSADDGRIIGYDASGTVVAVGDRVSGFAVGDEVYYAGDITRDGSNTTLQAVDERIVARKPATLSFADAAALPLTAITAWECLFDKLRLTADSSGRLLVFGGAGGVASIVIQLARALTELEVLAGAGRPESARWVLAMGAHHAVDRHDLEAAVERIAPEGVDHLFSSYSVGNVELFARVVRPFGQIVAIDADPGSLYPLKPRSLSWHWEYMFTRAAQRTDDMHTQGWLLARVADLVDAGTLSTTATVRLDGIDAPTLTEAHRLVGSGTVIGKVVVAR